MYKKLDIDNIKNKFIASQSWNQSSILWVCKFWSFGASDSFVYENYEYKTYACNQFE